MASLGSKLIRNALARDVPKELATVGGAGIGAALGSGEPGEEPDMLGALLGMVAGGVGGNRAGAVGQRLVRKSPLVGNPRMREPDVGKLTVKENRGRTSTTMYNFPAGKDNKATVRISGNNEMGVSVNMELEKTPSSLKNFGGPAMLKLFKDTFAAVDDYSAKTGVRHFVFTGDTPMKIDLYKTAMKKKGMIPEGYTAKMGDEGGLYIVKKGKEKAVAKKVKRFADQNPQYPLDKELMDL